MFAPGEIKKFSFILGLVLSALSTSIFAAEDLIIPEVCIDRAQEIGILRTSSTTPFRERLTQTKANWQVFDFEKIFDAYEGTIDGVNKDLENYKSPLFQFLQNCRNDQRSCHGYFQPTDKRHIQIYCDREIVISTIQTVLNNKDVRFNKCVEQPFDILKISDTHELQYDKSCYQHIQKDGEDYLKNKAHTYRKEIFWMKNLGTRLVDTTYEHIQKSLIPEGTIFIFKKVLEEFDDLDLREAKIRDLNLYYKIEDLLTEFSSCCDNYSPLMPESQLNLSYVRRTGQALNEGLADHGALIFQTHDYLSDLVFREAETQYWKDLTSTQSPLELSAKQKQEYFAFLKTRPFFLKDTMNFDEFVNEAKQHQRSEYTPRIVEADEYIEAHDAYKKERGYVEWPFYEAKPIDLNSEKQVMDNFLFDYSFQQGYSQKLEKDYEKVVKDRFEQQKQIDYPKITKAFLPYQYARASQAKIIRELQKMIQGPSEIDDSPNRLTASDVLKTVDTFHRWAEKWTCGGMEQTFCLPKYDAFRKKKHAELYDKLISGQIPMDYMDDQFSTQLINDRAYGNNKRQYIYDAEFVAEINSKIKTINKFCWDYADEKKYLSDQQYIKEYSTKFKQQMDDFYSTPRIDELLGNSEFFDVLKLSPSKAEYECLTSGYAFGGSPYLSDLGIKLTSPTGHATGGVPVYAYNALKGKNVREVYIPSIFKLNEEDFHDVEDDIEETIQDEFDTLNKVYHYNHFEDFEDFLRESVTVRIFALMDYAIDNPSASVGKYICDLIETSDQDEYGRMQTRQAIMASTLIIAGVVSVFVLPGVVAGTAVVWEAGMAVGFTSLGIASAVVEIQHYKHKQDLMDMASITQNIPARDAFMLQETYDDAIGQAKMTIALELGVLALFGTRPIIKATQYLQKVLDREYMLIRKGRQLRVDQFFRNSVREPDLYLSSRVEDFIYDYTKVADDKFEEFISALSKGEGENFLRTTWDKDIGQYLPIKKLTPKPWQQSMTALKDATYNALRRPFNWVEEKTVFMKPMYYRLSAALHDHMLTALKEERWYANMIDRYRREKSIVNLIKKSQELTAKTGKKIFSDSEIEELAKDMKYFRVTKDFKFYSVAEKEMEKLLDRFAAKVATGNKEEIIAYLKPLTTGELLQPYEWRALMKSFNGEINSIEDCKMLLKIIKFAKKEYTSIGSQLRNAPEVANFRELWKPHIYQQRSKDILDNINEFYSIAKYTKNKNDVRIVDMLQDYAKRTGKNVDELDAEIQKIDPDFSYKTKVSEYDAEKRMVLQFDEAKITGKYQKQFLRQERDTNDFFHRKLAKHLKRDKDISKAYKRALTQTQVRKSIETECALPDSITRKTANKQYVNFAKFITLTTNVTGYWANHYADKKDSEFWTRFGFDVAMPYIGSSLQADRFVQRGGGPLYKTFSDWKVSMFILNADASLYELSNNLFWDRDKKFEAEFARKIYQSENIEESVKEFFADHPDVQDQIIAKLHKLQDVFDQIELKISKGTMVDSEIEEMFIKAGLIDSVIYDDMKKQNSQLGKDYIYNELIENGYLDEELFAEKSSDEDLEQQVFDAMAESMYNDLYNDKDGEIKFPFSANPIDLGTIDWMEIHSADNPWFSWMPYSNETNDRLAFYIMYDTSRVPVAYLKNHLVYSALCNWRFLPGQWNVATALAIHAVYKSVMDPLKFYLREQATGH